jgi:hypothetical protein
MNKYISCGSPCLHDLCTACLAGIKKERPSLERDEELADMRATVKKLTLERDMAIAQAERGWIVSHLGSIMVCPPGPCPWNHHDKSSMRECTKHWGDYLNDKLPLLLSKFTVA